LLAGVAFDVIKSWTKAQILRPFLSAYQKLKIQVPVFEDPAKDRPCRFGLKLDVDATISSFSNSDYFRLWDIY
ncbi:MAG: hypothetical protein WBK08_08415, partial [Nitrospira sp.]